MSLQCAGWIIVEDEPMPGCRDAGIPASVVPASRRTFALAAAMAPLGKCFPESDEQRFRLDAIRRSR